MINYYGDQNRWFLARVIKGVAETANLDDNLFDKCQIRIIGLHSKDVPDKDLPFAKCILPTTEGGVSGIGKIPQLLEGAFVFGFFLDGPGSQNPIILGSLGHEGIPSSVQRDQISKTNPDQSLDETYVNKGIILDPNLETLYNSGKADVKTRMVIIMQFLRKQGLGTIAAAGVTGNLVRESTLNPEAKNISSKEQSYGLAQWNAKVGRWQMLTKFAKNRNKPWEDFFTQLEFLVHDMKTNGAHKVWNHMFDPQRTTDFAGGEVESNATWYFLTEYEVAAYSLQELKERESYAQQAYDAYYASLQVTAAHKAETQATVS